MSQKILSLCPLDRIDTNTFNESQCSIGIIAGALRQYATATFGPNAASVACGAGNMLALVEGVDTSHDLYKLSVSRRILIMLIMS